MLQAVDLIKKITVMDKDGKNIIFEEKNEVSVVLDTGELIDGVVEKLSKKEMFLFDETSNHTLVINFDDVIEVKVI